MKKNNRFLLISSFALLSASVTLADQPIIASNCELFVDKMQAVEFIQPGYTPVGASGTFHDSERKIVLWVKTINSFILKGKVQSVDAIAFNADGSSPIVVAHGKRFADSQDYWELDPIYVSYYKASSASEIKPVTTRLVIQAVTDTGAIYRSVPKPKEQNLSVTDNVFVVDPNLFNNLTPGFAGSSVDITQAQTLDSNAGVLSYFNPGSCR